MNLNLNNLSVVLGIAVALGGIILAFYRLFARFERMEKQAAHRKSDDEIILKSLSAVLDGLHEMGCNNTVTEMRAELKNHIIESR